MVKDDLGDVYTLPDSAFDSASSLTDKEFRVLTVLYWLAAGRPRVKKTHGQLGVYLNGASTETIRKATVGLREKGFISYRRTKRNFGKLSVNEYTLLHPARALFIAEAEFSSKDTAHKQQAPIRSGW